MDLSAPDIQHIDALARRVIDGLPGKFKSSMAGVVIRIEQWPERDVLDDLGIADRRDLLGLYTGISLTDKSSWDLPHGPDMIFLYRMPILDYARYFGETPEQVIRHVIIHEAGHHFGLSDDEMAAIEQAG